MVVYKQLIKLTIAFDENKRRSKLKLFHSMQRHFSLDSGITLHHHFVDLIFIEFIFDFLLHHICPRYYFDFSWSFSFIYGYNIMIFMELDHHVMN